MKHDEKVVNEVRSEHRLLSRETNRSLSIAGLAIQKLPDVRENLNDTKAINDVKAVKQLAASQKIKALKAAKSYVSHTLATQKNAFRKLSDPSLQPLPDAAEVDAYNAIKGAEKAATAKTEDEQAKKIAVSEATRLGFKASKKKKATKKTAKKAAKTAIGTVKTEKGPSPQFEPFVSKLKTSKLKPSNSTYNDLNIEQQIRQQAAADAGEDPSIPDEFAPKGPESVTSGADYTAGADFLESWVSRDVTAPTKVQVEGLLQDQTVQEKSASEAVEMAFDQAFHSPDALVQEP